MVVEHAEVEEVQHFRARAKAAAQSTGVQTTPLVGVSTVVQATRPGDFILTSAPDWSSRLITFGQRLRFRGKNRKFAYWNHAALIVGQNGEIIEALGPNPGVAQTSISKYAPWEYTIVRISASQQDRDEAVNFAKACLGEPYGVLTIVSIALSLLTGTRFSFGFEGQQICSGLVARALERTTAVFKKEPSHIMPADLAKAYAVTPPP